MKATRKVQVGSIVIGGGAPVSVQSMTNTPTADENTTLSQITALADAGCDLVRLAVTNEEEVSVCRRILSKTNVPLVADIQFDYKLAVSCSDIGFPKVRFNPGNIGSEAGVRALVDACKANGTAIRIGVNGGSLQKDLLEKYGKTPQALAESALMHAAILEKYGFYNTVLSVKSSDVRTCIQAYTLLHEKCDYPLHLGVTESGAKLAGVVKSSIGIGALLSSGIGDTIRVSLTGDPIAEVETALQILRSLGLRQGAQIVACPTCSRCGIDLAALYNEVEAMLCGVKVPVKVAVMGCTVNGPGEAADADFGVAGGKNGKSVLFSKGKVLKTVSNERIVPELQALLTAYLKNA